ncbi:hypothetical protein C8P67_113100 [Flavobacterium aquicola]|uniref:Uncharacterized protein n=1 Tax=Flavobacterium aquicola TaxID=1682742 RepID=A0A3E0E796_9FLAO|nr:hypothetical protein C8P67_113100 [Flavobacterium aquicola]
MCSVFALGMETTSYCGGVRHNRYSEQPDPCGNAQIYKIYPLIFTGIPETISTTVSAFWAMY